MLFSLFLYSIKENVTFLFVKKESANAKGNGDWHLRKSRPQNVYEEIFIFRHLLRRFLVPFDFSARVYGEKILNMQRCFSFSTSCRQSATKRTCVFFITDRSVKRSVLVCWLFRRQSNKKERTVVRSFRVWVYEEVSSRFLKRSRSSTRCR